MSIKDQMDWLRDLENDPEYVAEELKLDFANSMERLMKLCNINKRELAERIGSSQAYITKVLRGDANVTIETMAKLALNAEGMVHIHVTLRDAHCHWLESFGSRTVVEKPMHYAQCWAKSRTGELAA